MTSAPSDYPATISEPADQHTRFALRTGAAFFFVDLAVRLVGVAGLALLLTEATGQLPVQLITFDRIYYLLIDLVCGVMLWQGYQQWRKPAFILACVSSAPIVLRIIVFWSITGKGSLSTVLSQISLCVALACVLLGANAQWRTWTAITVFVLGYIGGNLFNLIGRL